MKSAGFSIESLPDFLGLKFERNQYLLQKERNLEVENRFNE
jgi:hypothetical protein